MGLNDYSNLHASEVKLIMFSAKSSMRFCLKIRCYRFKRWPLPSCSMITSMIFDLSTCDFCFHLSNGSFMSCFIIQGHQLHHQLHHVPLVQQRSTAPTARESSPAFPSPCPPAATEDQSGPDTKDASPSKTRRSFGLQDIMYIVSCIINIIITITISISIIVLLLLLLLLLL